MYAAPPVMQTKLVGRLSAAMHVTGRVSGRYATRKFYLEGPAMARDGTLYFTDVPWGRIFRMTPDGEISLFLEYDGEPNGMKFHKDGRLFVADYSRGILAIDVATKRMEPYCLRVGNERLRGPNDLVFASNGDLYFTDQGNSDILRPHGRVVRVRADGRPEILFGGVPSPNGLVLSPDEQWLYLAVTRTNCIWKVPLEVPPGLVPNEPVGTSGVFIQMSGGTGPDGMAVDLQGQHHRSPYRHGLPLDVQPARRAALPHPGLRRAVHLQRHLRRPGLPHPLHHRIGHGLHPDRRIALSR